jgi:hypothetical protein
LSHLLSVVNRRNRAIRLQQPVSLHELLERAAHAIQSLQTEPTILGLHRLARARRMLEKYKRY